MTKKTALLILLTLSACSFKKNRLLNQTQNGHDELYSEPEAPKEHKDSLKRLVVVATNDLQGKLAPQTLSFRDEKNPGIQSTQVGGVDVMSAYFKILRATYGEILAIDSGNVFPDKVHEASAVQDFYSSLGYDAMTLGLRDFILRVPTKSSSDYFKEFSKKSKVPVLLSNLYELKTARVVEWTGTMPYLLKDVNGVKVGIIGVVPDDIVTQTPTESRVGLYVENMLQSTLRHARLLRSLGAEIIVVLTHQGLNCGDDLAEKMGLPLTKVNFEPQQENVCDLKGPLGEYLQRLPPQLVDVVVGGRNKRKVANFVNGVLVVSSFGEGKSFSRVELFVDPTTKKIVKDRTVVHQPVMFCREFFKETNDCYTEDPSVDHKERSEAQFLGSPVLPDESIKSKFLPYFEQKEAFFHNDLKDTIVTDAMKKHGATLAYAQEGNGDSQLITLSVKGQDLIRILEEDFNQGHSERWPSRPFRQEKNELSLMVEGKAIDPAITYTVLSDIESLQGHSGLRHYVPLPTSRSLPTLSWNLLKDSVDTVHTQMASTKR